MRSANVFCVIGMLACAADLTQGCHYIQHLSGRNKRSVILRDHVPISRDRPNSASDPAATAVLRDFFAHCLGTKAEGVLDSYRAVVALTVLLTNWYGNSENICREGTNDTPECWSERLGDYMLETSPLMNATRACITEYENKTRDHVNQYITVTVTEGGRYRRSTSRIRQRFATGISRYADCLSEWSRPDETIAWNEAKTVAIIADFVDNHTRCSFTTRDCRIVGHNTAITEMWPYRLEALLLTLRVRDSVHTCNNRVFPLTEPSTSESSPRQPVYTTPPPGPLFGGWTEWESWGHCPSRQCHEPPSHRLRRRQCIRGTPGKSPCVGNIHEQKQCRAENCDFNWQPWSDCQATCNIVGTQKRHRLCSIDELRNCSSGRLIEIRKCRSANQACASCAHWSSWGNCEGNCGEDGKQHRYRICLHPHSRRFHDEKECTVSCGSWSSWGNFSRCNAKCGHHGKQERVRECINGEPGQRGCWGKNTEEWDCHASESNGCLP